MIAGLVAIFTVGFRAASGGGPADAGADDKKEPVGSVAETSKLLEDHIGHIDWEAEGPFIEQAIEHRGYALVDIFQQCVTFNRVNTLKWFRDNTYYLDDSYDPTDRTEAFRTSTSEGKFALGVLYVNEDRKPFEDNLPAYARSDTPLFARERDLGALAKLIASRG